jgi:hypothetical protein
MPAYLKVLNLLRKRMLWGRESEATQEMSPSYELPPNPPVPRRYREDVNERQEASPEVYRASKNAPETIYRASPKMYSGPQTSQSTPNASMVYAQSAQGRRNDSGYYDGRMVV